MPSRPLRLTLSPSFPFFRLHLLQNLGPNLTLPNSGSTPLPLKTSPSSPTPLPSYPHHRSTPAFSPPSLSLLPTFSLPTLPDFTPFPLSPPPFPQTVSFADLPPPFFPFPPLLYPYFSRPSVRSFTYPLSPATYDRPFQRHHTHYTSPYRFSSSFPTLTPLISSSPPSHYSSFSPPFPEEASSLFERSSDCQRFPSVRKAPRSIPPGLESPLRNPPPACRVTVSLSV